MVSFSDIKLGIVGLGYVGLPLAVEFGKNRSVVGFDINKTRVAQLKSGHDSTNEISEAELRSAGHTVFTTDVNVLSECNCFIITVPTPVDRANRPDLTPLIKASRTVGSILKPGNIVIYESTVYPGATEEDCVPVLEAESGLRYASSEQGFPEDLSAVFYCGYSPERINPGDKDRRVSNIVKVTSGSTPEVADLVDRLYCEIVTVGTHRAPSIKVAEASKVIENVQRDVNIAVVNELAIIFNRLKIDTEAVLVAAGTKWNFLNFRPGLVGGHCIGIDPYYLKYKAQSVGYHPEIISAVRRLNDGMGHYVVSQLVKKMIKNRVEVQGGRVLVLGITFKENCPDIRNTRVIDIVNELKEFECEVDIYDPWADAHDVAEEYGLALVERPRYTYYDGIVVAVAHTTFRELGVNEIRKFGKPSHVLYDLKYLFSEDQTDLRL